MDKQPQSRAPLIIAILLLLLPVYVASYLAIVIPGGEIIVPRSATLPFLHSGVTRKYKLGGSVSETIFYPLEQIDRTLRPGAWRSSSFLNDHRSLQIEKNLGAF